MFLLGLQTRSLHFSLENYLYQSEKETIHNTLEQKNSYVRERVFVWVRVSDSTLVYVCFD